MNTSHEALSIICSLYERQDKLRLITFKAHLFSIPFVGFIASHLIEVKTIQNQLNTLSTPFSNYDLVSNIINILPSKYNSFIPHLFDDFAKIL